jgi:hypothetical protein
MFSKRAFLSLVTAAITALPLVFSAQSATAQVTGALFTTDSTCTGVDLNIYTSKEAVWIDGGPTRKGLATGLPDGSYFVRVTSPDGKTILGETAPTELVKVVNGEFEACYQLTAILVSPGGARGYDDTPNNGGEYKVWISQSSDFPNRESKTDNFKVVPSAGLDTDRDGILDEDESPDCISNPDPNCGVVVPPPEIS